MSRFHVTACHCLLHHYNNRCKYYTSPCCNTDNGNTTGYSSVNTSWTRCLLLKSDSHFQHIWGNISKSCAGFDVFHQHAHQYSTRSKQRLGNIFTLVAFTQSFSSHDFCSALSIVHLHDLERTVGRVQELEFFDGTLGNRVESGTTPAPLHQADGLGCKHTTNSSNRLAATLRQKVKC